MGQSNLHNCTLRMLVGGQPTLVFIKDNPYQIYVDLEGGHQVQLQNGMFLLPIESIDNFKCYEELPDRSLARYFSDLIEKVYELEPDGDQKVDICKLQQQLLSQRWNIWLNKGYVTDEDPLPSVLYTMGLIKEQKKKTFWGK